MNPSYAYAEEAVDVLQKSVNQGNTIIKIGQSLILGFLTLGLLSTAAGWLLDVAQKQKIKAYMEISIYLIAMLVPVVFFSVVYYQIKKLTGM
jgi:hypothetical protein